MRIDRGPTRIDRGPTRIDRAPTRIDRAPTRIDRGPARSSEVNVRATDAPSRTSGPGLASPSRSNARDLPRTSRSTTTPTVRDVGRATPRAPRDATAPRGTGSDATPRTVAPRDGSVRADRSALRPSLPERSTLRDRYRREPSSTPRSRQPTSAPGSSATFRDTLSSRYRDRSNRDTAPKAAAPAARDGRPLAPRGRANDASGSTTRRGIAADRYALANGAARPSRGGASPDRSRPALTPHTGQGLRARDRNATSAPTDRRPWRGPPSSYAGGASDYYYGCSSWASSSWSLGFSFGYAPSWCHWGLYSYPYYYCAYWPSWYYCYNQSFCFGWNARYPWTVSWYWWWPSSCYLPSAYVSYYGAPYYYGYYGGGYGSGYSAGYGEGFESGYEEGSYYRSSYRGGAVAATEDEAGTEPEAGAAAPARDSGRHATAERHVSLGDFYFREERFAEAVESYLRALAYAPDDATIHLVLADSLFAMGDYHYAAFMIGKALQLDPSLASAGTDKRSFYKNRATFDAHLDALRRYVGEKPYDAAAHLVLGYNLRFSRASDLAEVAFRRVLEIDPGNQAATLFAEALAQERTRKSKRMPLD